MDKSDNSRLLEISPHDPHVAQFVEKYQFYRFDSESWIKTVPNARLECWQIFAGGFTIWDQDQKCFFPAPTFGGYPSTNTSMLFHIPEELYCINIKFYLRALSLPFLRKLYPPDPTQDIEKYIQEYTSHRLNLHSIYLHGKLKTNELDHWIKGILKSYQPDQMVDAILAKIGSANIQTVKQLADALNQSPRNLQRIVRLKFNMSPKELLSIHRFSQTTSHLKMNLDRYFIEALSFGYYDQSHFIRECKRLTGVSPKELFANMRLSTPDLMILKSK